MLYNFVPLIHCVPSRRNGQLDLNVNKLVELLITNVTVSESTNTRSIETGHASCYEEFSIIKILVLDHQNPGTELEWSISKCHKSEDGLLLIGCFLDDNSSCEGEMAMPSYQPEVCSLISVTIKIRPIKDLINWYRPCNDISLPVTHILNPLILVCMLGIA